MTLGRGPGKERGNTGGEPSGIRTGKEGNGREVKRQWAIVQGTLEGVPAERTRLPRKEIWGTEG